MNLHNDCQNQRLDHVKLDTHTHTLLPKAVYRTIISSLKTISVWPQLLCALWTTTDGNKRRSDRSTKAEVKEFKSSTHSDIPPEGENKIIK